MRTVLILLLCIISSFTRAQDINCLVLEEAERQHGGGYNWSSTGVYQDLILGQHKFMSKSKSGTYCSGYTFNVAFETLKRLDVLPDSLSPKIKRFQHVWYGIPAESMETQGVLALEEMGGGCSKSLKEASPGDFVQFWRNNNSGHAVIFIDWIKNEKSEIIGLTYRSSQKQTNGIGVRTESIGYGTKDINPKRIYIARIEL